MAEQVVMPKLGLTMEEGTLIRWLKKPGEQVHKGEIILEVEGDKETAQVACQFDGTLLSILVAEGRTVPVKTPIAVVGRPGETISQPEAAEPTPAGRVFISPRARKLAELEGIDWHALSGSGPGSGRIQEKDVLAFRLKRAGASTVAAPCGSASFPATAPASRRVAFSTRRTTIARRLRDSVRQAPHIYLWAEIDCTEALAFKDRYNRAHAQSRLGLTDLIIKAAGRCLMEHEQLNAQVDEESLTLLPHADIGIAVGMDEGVLVPVLRQVETKSLAAIAAESRLLVEKARSGGLAAADMDGGSFTITNLGPFGVTRFTAIINPPQAAILAVGAVVERVTVMAGAPVVRPIMEVCLGADHRAVDGLHAAAFLKSLATCLEDPLACLA